MSKDILMQFVGFESKAAAREYTFAVLEASCEPRQFTITIANEAFSQRRARFQDAPDICALKLRHELTTSDNHPSESHFHITNTELDDYRNSHTSPKRDIFHKPTEEY